MCFEPSINPCVTGTYLEPGEPAAESSRGLDVRTAPQSDTKSPDLSPAFVSSLARVGHAHISRLEAKDGGRCARAVPAALASFQTPA